MLAPLPGKDAHRFAGTWPEIMNTDQGCQFTSQDWTGVLRDAGVRISVLPANPPASQR